jgi:Tfp pilus assembly protein PilN
MKKGIHLGPPIARGAFASTFALLALGAVGLALSGLAYRAYRDVATIEAELHGGEGAGSAHRESDRVETSREAVRLRSVVQSGVLESIPPTRALAAVSAALPDGVVLVSLSLKASPPNRNVLLEALADDGEKVTELQRRMARSPMVTATRLLEERRSIGERLLVRLQVDLAEPVP